jgi:hypothetical protein
MWMTAALLSFGAAQVPGQPLIVEGRLGTPGLIGTSDAAKASPPETVAIHTLKGAYLACERETSGTRMDEETASRCSGISNELVRRAFGGDFERMIRWYGAEKARTLRGGSL